MKIKLNFLFRILFLLHKRKCFKHFIAMNQLILLTNLRDTLIIFILVVQMKKKVVK